MCTVPWWLLSSNLPGPKDPHKDVSAVLAALPCVQRIIAHNCSCPAITAALGRISPLPTLVLHSTFHAAAKIMSLNLRPGDGPNSLEMPLAISILNPNSFCLCGKPGKIWTLLTLLGQLSLCPSLQSTIQATSSFSNWWYLLSSAFLTHCKNGVHPAFHASSSIHCWPSPFNCICPGIACISLLHCTTCHCAFYLSFVLL